MASSKCGHCAGLRFEIKLVEPVNGRFKQYFIQCASCGVPVGALDYFNLGTELQDRKSEIEAVDKRLKRIEELVVHIARCLDRP